MGCADAIVATIFWNPEADIGSTMVDEAKSAVLNATEKDRFLVKSVQGIPTAGNEKGIRYAMAKDTLLNDVKSLNIRVTNWKKRIHRKS
jgi:hypothetical protein